MQHVTPLKRILKAERRTQAWLSKETGIDEATLSRIVNGLHANEDKRRKIASKLGRDEAEVFGTQALEDAA